MSQTERPGPVSEHLEQTLLARIRQHKSVFWLDSSGAFTSFIDGLVARRAAGDFPFPVVPFRGSYLEVMLALRDVGSGREKPSMVVHLPGLRAVGVRDTPLLELYEPGHHFEPSLETAVREAATGQAEPGVIEAYLQGPGLSVAGADAWLLAQRAGHVDPSSELEQWLAATSLGLIAEELLGRDTCLKAKLTTDADAAALAAYLHRNTGMNDDWRAFCRRSSLSSEHEQLGFALAAWVLCVEFVRDLSRPPRLSALLPMVSLSRPLVEACSKLIHDLRGRHPAAYMKWADEVERALLPGELSELKPEELGQIDTFRREERSVLQAAIDALVQGEFRAALAWARAREGSASFWLERDKHRRWEWTLVGHAAALAEAIARHPSPFAGARSLAEAVDAYRQGAHEVDRAHRRFEQARLHLLDLQQEHFIDLRDTVTRVLRESYRRWADQLTGAFCALCREHGALPERGLQQRAFFEDVVLPLCQEGERAVVFLVDAFRYEMATELVADLGGGGANVALTARLAELPTLTAVGMNAVAPVQEGGRLRVTVTDGAFKGFQRGEFRVNDPKTRARAMGERAISSAATQMTLDEVCNEDPAALRKKIAASKKLIVVHSTEIDDAGEANLGLSTFERTLRDLRNAFTHLQAAGVKQFVFTADHGFLLQDPTATAHAWGSRRDPERRHIYSKQPRSEPDLLTVSFAQLGYEGAEGYLLFRQDTGVFATARGGGSFVHGGNSPQERVVPVLTVTRKREASRSFSTYRVEARPEEPVLGTQVVALHLDFERQQNATLDFVAKDRLELVLRVPGRDDITVALRDASGGASLHDGRLFVAVGSRSARVYFALKGRRDERVAIEAYCPDGSANVKPHGTEATFAVERELSVAPPPAARASLTPWQERLGEEGAVRVFEHIEQKGAITEQEIISLLGSPRAARKFALAFDGYLLKLPFRVRIETGQGKVYVKDGDR